MIACSTLAPAALALLVALAAPAAENDAKAFFQAGAQAYDAGRYDAAVQAFDEAYRLTPHPGILFSMAQAERKHFFVSRERTFLERAVEHYRLYLDSPRATRAAEARAAVADLEEARLRLSNAAPAPAAPSTVELAKARLMVTTQATAASVMIDDAAPVEAPFIGEVAAGRHRVRVSAEGYFPEEREVEVALGATAGLDLPLKERAGQLSLEAPSGSTIYVDGEMAGDVPLTRPLELPAGTHSVTVIRRGMYPWSGEVAIERGTPAKMQASMERTTQRVASLIVLGTAAALFGAGALCASSASGEAELADQIRAEQALGNITSERLAEYNAAVQSHDDLGLGAMAGFGAGSVLLTVGGLMYLLDHPTVARGTVHQPDHLTPSRLPVELGATLLPVPGGAGVSAFGRF